MTWERDTSAECPDVDEGSATITDGSTSYIITGLEEDSSYIITVAATNAAVSTVSVPVTAMTGEAGEEQSDAFYGLHKFSNHIFFQLHLPLPLMLVHLMLHHAASLSSGGQ